MSYTDLPLKPVSAAIALAVLIVLETVWPFKHPLGNAYERAKHDGRNFAWGLINLLVGALFVSTLLVTVDGWAVANRVGILRQVALPLPLKLLGAMLLLDLWMYAWHRINHSVPFLWRFHRMHHSDREVDTSTGVRFHTGEILLSGLARLVVVPLLGVSIPQLFVYEAILLPIILLHHSNIRLPRWLDFALARLIVSPALHRVHHSQRREETNSNYGSISPWWDWMFGTIRLRHDVENITFGLDDLHSARPETMVGMATTPLGAVEFQPRERRCAEGDAENE